MRRARTSEGSRSFPRSSITRWWRPSRCLTTRTTKQFVTAIVEIFPISIPTLQGWCPGDRDDCEEPGPLPQREPAAGGHRRDGGHRADGIHPPGQVPARDIQVQNSQIHFWSAEYIHITVCVIKVWELENSLWIKDHSATKVPPCVTRGAAGGLQGPGHGEHGAPGQGEAHPAVHRGGGGLQPGGDDRVLQRRPRPPHQVRPLQGVCPLPWDRWQLLSWTGNNQDKCVIGSFIVLLQKLPTQHHCHKLKLQ